MVSLFLPPARPSSGAAQAGSVFPLLGLQSDLLLALFWAGKYLDCLPLGERRATKVRAQMERTEGEEEESLHIRWGAARGSSRAQTSSARPPRGRRMRRPIGAKWPKVGPGRPLPCSSSLTFLGANSQSKFGPNQHWPDTMLGRRAESSPPPPWRGANKRPARPQLRPTYFSANSAEYLIKIRLDCGCEFEDLVGQPAATPNAGRPALCAGTALGGALADCGDCAKRGR